MAMARALGHVIYGSDYPYLSPHEHVQLEIFKYYWQKNNLKSTHLGQQLDLRRTEGSFH